MSWSFGPADHHLDLSQVAACELLETFGQPIKLQPMILPDTHQVAPVRVRLPTIVRTVIDPGEDWVVRVSDLYKPILVFDQPVCSSLAREPLVESDDRRAKCLPDQLVTAADCQHRHFDLSE